MLVYGTTGVGLVDTGANFTINSPFLPPSRQSANISETGFVIGGLDFKVLPRLSLATDALFYTFANAEQRLSTDAGGAFWFHDHTDITVVRRRITYYYYFNPPY